MTGSFLRNTFFTYQLVVDTFVYIHNQAILKIWNRPLVADQSEIIIRIDHMISPYNSISSQYSENHDFSSLFPGLWLVSLPHFPQGLKLKKRLETIFCQNQVCKLKNIMGWRWASTASNNQANKWVRKVIWVSYKMWIRFNLRLAAHFPATRGTKSVNCCDVLSLTFAAMYCLSRSLVGVLLVLWNTLHAKFAVDIVLHW